MKRQTRQMLATLWLLGLGLLAGLSGVAQAATVTITSPVSDAVFAVPAYVTLEANVTNTDPSYSIMRVEFYQNNTLIGTATTVPYRVTWNYHFPGHYSLTARAIGNTGTISSAAVPIVVGLAPTVSLTSPAANARVEASGTVTLEASAADIDGTISKVEFYRNNTLIGTATTAPYRVSWSNMPRGHYSLTAKATDNGGLVLRFPLLFSN